MKQLFKRLAALALCFSVLAAALPTVWAEAPDTSGDIYISGYDVQYTQRTRVVKDGQVVQRATASAVTFTITDTRVRQTVLPDNILVQINGSNFSAPIKIGEDSNPSVQIATPYASPESAGGSSLCYTITYKDLEYNGGSNTFSLDISYWGTDAGGKKVPLVSGLELGNVSQSLFEFVSVSETSPEATPTPSPTPSPTPTPEPGTRTPGLIVRSTSIGGSTIQAGEDFTLSLEIYATASGTENLCDVLVAINPAEGVTLREGSTTKYIGAMAPGGSQTVTFPMKALNSFTGGTSSVSVSISAAGEQTGGACSATGTTVTVPVLQPERFEISRLEAPETLTVGEEGYVTITFVNKGKNALGNLTASLSGTNIVNADQNEFVGNLAAGSEHSVDFDLSAVEEGTLDGLITLVYEDSSGSEVTVTQGFSCPVTAAEVWDDPGMYDPGMGMEPEPAAAGLPWWVFVILAVVLAVGVFVGMKVVKKRRAAKAAAGGEDEDF